MTAPGPLPPDFVFGLMAMHAGDHRGAAQKFCGVLADLPAHDEVLSHLGHVSALAGQTASGLCWMRRACRVAPMQAAHHLLLGATLLTTDRPADALPALRAALALDPANQPGWYNLTNAAFVAGNVGLAERAADRTERLAGLPALPRLSAIIPVLEETSPHAPWNIRTLLDDLKSFTGEVICVFNDQAVGARLRGHPRIDKWSLNSANVGVARGWNIGLALAEGEILFVLNADLNLAPGTLEAMANWFAELPDALMIGVEGKYLDERLNSHGEVLAGRIAAPVKVDRLVGYCFALHAGRLHDHGLTFDPRLSPYFYEEIDLALKANAHGLAAYVVPVSGVQHHFGISGRDRPIQYFGRPVIRNVVMLRNWRLLRAKRARGLIG